MGLLYYMAITVATLSIAIFNFSIYSTGKKLQCYHLSTMDEAGYKEYTTNFKNNNDESNSKPNPNAPQVVQFKKNNINYYSVPMISDNIYKTFAVLIAISYLIIMLFSMLLCIILLWMSNMVPDDFLNMSRIKKAAAVITKVLPPCLVLIHWLIMLLIIIFWIVIVAERCIVTEPFELTYGFNSLRYHNSCITLQIVNTVIFFVLHYVAAVFKDMIYIEPFMYSPQVGEKSMFKNWCLRILGP